MNRSSFLTRRLLGAVSLAVFVVLLVIVFAVKGCRAPWAPATPWRPAFPALARPASDT